MPKTRWQASETSPREPLPLARLSARDLAREVIAGIVQRPTRSVMTAFGTMLGIAVLIAVLGLTGSAAAQISSRFDPVVANEVSLTDRGDGVAVASYTFRSDAESRVRSIAGVTSVGLGWLLEGVKAPLSTLPPRAGELATQFAPIMAASPGFLEEAGVVLSAGTEYTSWHEENASPIVMIGAQVARDLSLAQAPPGSVMWIDGRRFTLAGIVATTQRHPEILTSVLMPTRTARSTFGEARSAGKYAVWATTQPGAAQVVADQLAYAVNPDRAHAYQVNRPADPRALRDRVDSDLSQLLLLLAAVSLIIGMVGIANTTFVAVIERTGEIGLRRSLGAASRHILAQFWSEAAVLGGLGGLNGASLGVVVVLVTCWAKQWTAVLDWRLTLAGPLLGLVVGGFAGLYPAWRASKIEPVEALRHGQ